MQVFGGLAATAMVPYLDAGSGTYVNLYARTTVALTSITRMSCLHQDGATWLAPNFQTYRY